MTSAIHNQAISHCLRPLLLTGLLFGQTLWFGPKLNLARAGQEQAASAEGTVAAFNERVKQYIKAREKVEAKLPKLSNKSTPAEIEANLVALQAGIMAARP